MKTNLEKVSNLNRKLSIEIPANVVQTEFDRAFNGVQKEVTIKGFRKGKAPIAMIKSMYGDRIKQDVAQNLIRSHYPSALTEHNLEPISSPEFEFEDPNELGSFSFSASFDIRPEVNLRKFEGLEVEREKLEFDEKKVDQVLENIRSSRATQVDVLENRPAKTGDIAIVDFEGFVDGKPLENGAGQNHPLELGSNSFIAGFEEGIVGMSLGQTKTINLKFPEPYHAPELSGKPVDFKVTLQGLKKKELPELNEELLKSLGGPSNVEDLKKSIREDLEATEKKRIEDAFKNRLLKALVSANPVDVPASLQAEQKQMLIEDFKKRMADQGMPETDFEVYASKWDADFNKTAAEMIQSSFLVDALAKKQDLVCKKEDIEKKFADYAKQTGLEESRIREWYGRPDQMSRLTYLITEEKVIGYLTSVSKIKELPKSQIKDDAT